MSPDNQQWRPSSTHRSDGAYRKNGATRNSHVNGLEFNLVRYDAGFNGGRHTHAFDQIRIGLEGEIPYGRQMLAPRVLGYFPAGTYYGPHTSKEPATYAMLQWDGSGEGFHCTIDEIDSVSAKMRSWGTFSKGVFTQNDTGVRTEAWQACFMEVTGRQPVIPAERYPDPVFMNIDAFEWRREQGEDVSRKTLGVFGDPETRFEMLQLPAGVSITLGGQGKPVIAFVMDGALRGDNADIDRWSSILTEEDDILTLTGKAELSEILIVTLPHFNL
jgi:hypothetical protein